jgi:hypothetical protein
MCALIKGQCSKPTLEKIEAMQGHAGIRQGRNPIRLLGLVKEGAFNCNSKKCRATSLLVMSKPDLVSETRCMKFRTQLDVLKSAGGETEDELARANVAPRTGTDAQTATAGAAGRRLFEAALFLAKSDQGRCRWLVLQELANDFNRGGDSHPESLTAACELMLHDAKDQDSRPQPHGSGGMAFNVVGKGGVPETNTQLNPRADITCHKHQKVGHFSAKCTETTHANGTALVNAGQVAVPPDGVSALGDDGGASAAPATGTTLNLMANEMDNSACNAILSFQFMANGTVNQGHSEQLMSQRKAMTGHVIPETWMPLDDQSTVDVFCNKDLLRNIREGETTCRISCNAGTAETRLIGNLPGC